MSKLNQIETKLKEIDQARFQKLCDQYLHSKGYENINPVGVMIGADKVVKGTPDSLIALPNGKYIFAEYTTQNDGVFGKFLDDLAKCFDQAKTGIPVEKIEKIILCHNSRLKPDEDNALAEECQRHGCNLRISFALHKPSRHQTSLRVLRLQKLRPACADTNRGFLLRAHHT